MEQTIPRKIRVSVTIDSRVLKYIDKKIAELKFRNRSHAIEYAVCFMAKTEYEEQQKKKLEQAQTQPPTS